MTTTDFFTKARLKHIRAEIMMWDFGKLKAHALHHVL